MNDKNTEAPSLDESFFDAGEGLVGKQFGHYQVLGELGKGGMATVYKADELSLNRVVALKVMSPKISDDPTMIKRFKREAQAAAQLNHPAIVQIFAIGEEKGIHYFTMEYIRGKSLAQLRREKGSLTPGEAVPYLVQTAEALGEAHRHGMVHRDIKPSNIMLDKAGRVKVTDFGIAHVASAQTQLTVAGSFLGTPQYMSPEQCEGKPVDGRSDIYSLGVTFYELITGRSPFEAETPGSMLVKIVKGEFKPLQEIDPNIPAGVRTVIEKMLKTSPKKRYQNTDEVITALKNLAKVVSQDTGATAFGKTMATVAPAAPAPKQKNRWLVPAAAAALLLVVLASAAIVFAPPRRRDTDVGEAKTPETAPVESAAPQTFKVGPAAPAPELSPATSEPPAAPEPAAKPPVAEAAVKPPVSEEPVETAAAPAAKPPETVPAAKPAVKAPAPEPEPEPAMKPAAPAPAETVAAVVPEKPAALPTPQLPAKAASPPAVPAVPAPEAAAAPEPPPAAPPKVSAPIEPPAPATQPGTEVAMVVQPPPAVPAVAPPPAPPKPPADSLIVTTSGDYQLGGVVTSHAQSFLKGTGYGIVDKPLDAGQDAAAVAEFELLIEISRLGTTQLKYMGRTSDMHTDTLTMKLIRSGDGKLVAGPFKQTVQHTALNAEQKLEEAVRKLTVELRGAVDR